MNRERTVNPLTFQSTSSDGVLIVESECEKLIASTVVELARETYAFAHEAGIWVNDNEVFFTSNRLKDESGEQFITISKIDLTSNKVERIESSIAMGNGGTNYQGKLLFCAQGNRKNPYASGLVVMEPRPPYQTRHILNNFHGRPFNSVNDVVVHPPTGHLYFTDPSYGYAQGFKDEPALPEQSYVLDPATGSIRVISNFEKRPNGIALSPDYKTLYITDTSVFPGGIGKMDLRNPSAIYAYDILPKFGGITNRRLFAFVDYGFPDGIKCDVDGNVWTGCGDGVHIFNPAGKFLGKVLCGGGVANFVFVQDGIVMLNETRIMHIKTKVSGALK